MEIKVQKPLEETPAAPAAEIPATVEKIPETPVPPVPPKRPVGRPPGTGRRAKEDSIKPDGPGARARIEAAKAVITNKPPDFAEWTEFIGTVVLRWAARGISAVILRGIDRDTIDPADLDEIDLDEEQLTALAKPFAHVADRSKFLTKHGRAIIDSKDAIEAAVILFMWMGRVNRVAKKYRPRHAVKGEVENGTVNSGADVQGPAASQFGAVGAGFN